MKKTTVKKSIVGILIIILLWGMGVIPEAIGKISSKSYVSSIHSNLNLAFYKLEFSSAHGTYFAIFHDSDGNSISFQMKGGRFFPLGVWKDPLHNPS